MNDKQYLLSLKRSHYVSKAIIFFIILTWTYIGYLQIFQGERYQEKSVKNFTRYTQTQAVRGMIVDCNGIPLAITKPFVTLLWNSKPSQLSEDDKELLSFIKNECLITIEKDLFNSEDLYVALSDKLSFEQLSILLEKYPSHNRLSLRVNTSRTYPFSPCACHIIGYLSFAQNSGISGIEKLYNESLFGKQGVQEAIIDARGKILKTEDIVKRFSGETIITTIDSEVQNILEKIFPNTIKGCAIIMDAETGALRAALSSPRFDPEMFLSRINIEDWNKYIEDECLVNRFGKGEYAPASLFKLVSVTAMLEEGYADSNKKWFCPGFIEFKGRRYHCHKKTGHGTINLLRAMSVSCNIPFYSAAIEGLSIDTLSHYAKMLGLGQKTDIGLPESVGIVPSRLWKKSTYKQPWYQGETLSVIIGQGATVSTPLQLARMVNAIMTGNLVKPHILASEEIQKKSIPISNQTRSMLKLAMKCATLEGSAWPLRGLKNWDIYSKTGTAQVCSLEKSTEKKDFDHKKMHHGLLACYASYKKNPPFVLIIIMEHVNTSSVTAQFARSFFDLYEKHLAKNELK